MKVLKTILLIEDDKDDQEFFIDALSGIEDTTLYYVANNGVEALAKLRDCVILPDMIFSDINMPLMNGIECLLQIKQNPKTRNIPFVILTTSSGMSDAARQHGANGVIKKPSVVGALRREVEQMINKDFIAETPPKNLFFQNMLSLKRMAF